MNKKLIIISLVVITALVVGYIYWKKRSMDKKAEKEEAEKVKAILDGNDNTGIIPPMFADQGNVEGVEVL